MIAFTLFFGLASDSDSEKVENVPTFVEKVLEERSERKLGIFKWYFGEGFGGFKQSRCDWKQCDDGFCTGGKKQWCYPEFGIICTKCYKIDQIPECGFGGKFGYTGDDPPGYPKYPIPGCGP